MSAVCCNLNRFTTFSRKSFIPKNQNLKFLTTQLPHTLPPWSFFVLPRLFRGWLSLKRQDVCGIFQGNEIIWTSLPFVDPTHILLTNCQYQIPSNPIKRMKRGFFYSKFSDPGSEQKFHHPQNTTILYSIVVK